jgi:hypothetical protein
VGFACLHHLYHVNQCRALFATHFHALADMTESFGKLGHYCNDVLEEEDGTFSYVYRLRKGVNRKSHALKVARLAGESGFLHLLQNSANVPRPSRRRCRSSWQSIGTIRDTISNSEEESCGQNEGVRCIALC